ncbi:unnamed protein product, partial [Protopolystoma xenopodis]
MRAQTSGLCQHKMSIGLQNYMLAVFYSLHQLLAPFMDGGLLNYVFIKSQSVNSSTVIQLSPQLESGGSDLVKLLLQVLSDLLTQPNISNEVLEVIPEALGGGPKAVEASKTSQSSRKFVWLIMAWCLCSLVPLLLASFTIYLAFRLHWRCKGKISMTNR